jgi:hypothetical protein
VTAAIKNSGYPFPYERICIYGNDLIQIGQVDHHSSAAQCRIAPEMPASANGDF